MGRILPMLLGILLLGNGVSAKSKYVSVNLDAKWNSTPLLLETSEYLAQESNGQFWKFVEKIAELDPQSYVNGHDESMYRLALKMSEPLLSPLHFRLMKFSLSLRAHSPTVEMFNQIAREQKPPADCEAFVDVNNMVTDEVPAFRAFLKTAENQKSPLLIKNDHQYPGQSSSKITVILYAEIGTKGFSDWHKELAKLARDGTIIYVLRHFIKEPTTIKTRLSGYGVELAIKSQEYKAKDDTKVDDGSDKSEQSEDDDDEIQGFNFGTLKKRHPDLKEELSEFRQHMVDSNNELAPMKVWEYQDLSLQASQKVLNAPVEEQLGLLRDISQNFPSLARSLSKSPVKDEFKKEMKKNQQMFEQQFGLGPGDSAMFINGQQADLDIYDVFTLLDTMKDEATLMEGLHALGLDSDSMNGLLKLDLRDTDSNYAIDMRDPSVVFVNNIEKDKRYQGWPSSLQEMLRPTFPGMLRHIRKNMFSLAAKEFQQRQESFEERQKLAEESATRGQEEATGGQEKATWGQEEATGGHEEATEGQEEATGGQEEATGGHEEATAGQGEATGGQKESAVGDDIRLAEEEGCTKADARTQTRKKTGYSKHCQTKIPQRTTSTDVTGLTPVHSVATQHDTVEEWAEEEWPDEAERDTTKDDPTFKPNENTKKSTYARDSEELILVCKSKLLQLLTICRFCAEPATVEEEVHRLGKQGTMFSANMKCTVCHREAKWQNQYLIRQMPMLNLLMSACVYVSGTAFAKGIRLFEFLKVRSVSVSTLYRHARQYIVPQILLTWRSHQRSLIESTLAAGEKLTLLGDARSDSPGHCAKYGTYTLMDGTSGKVLTMEVVQSNEVGGSYHCELEGLKRGLEKIGAANIHKLVTDRHRQIAKWLRENMPFIHSFDVWHVAKGLNKKLSALAKTKECEAVAAWKQSIINHLYWCAMSSQEGAGDIILGKWKSLMEHLCDRHEDFPDATYPQCQHGPMEGYEWIVPGSKAETKLEAILMTTMLKGDVKKLSTTAQTSNLESFHSVQLMFVPKHTAYSYHGMRARSALAALHWNANTGRGQALTGNGEERFVLVYPKAKCGEVTVKKVKEDASYDYAEDLIRALYIRFCDEPASFARYMNTLNPAPLSLSAQCERVDKAQAVAEFRTRFT